MRIGGAIVLGMLAAAGCERLLVLDPVSLDDAGGDAVAPADVAPGDGSGGSGMGPCSTPFAHYEFENPSVLADSSANHYDGVIRSPGPIVEVGEQGRAYELDGTDNVAELDYTVFQVTPLTVSVWLEPSATGEDGCLLDQAARSQTTYGASWRLCLQGGQLVLHLDPSTEVLAGSASADTWQHAVVELDGTTASLWLDGSNGSVTATPQYDNSSPIVIGAEQASAAGYDRFYAGGIDELEFFHCAVPADQLGNL